MVAGASDPQQEGPGRLLAAGFMYAGLRARTCAWYKEHAASQTVDAHRLATAAHRFSVARTGTHSPTVTALLAACVGTVRVNRIQVASFASCCLVQWNSSSAKMLNPRKPHLLCAELHGFASHYSCQVLYKHYTTLVQQKTR